MAWHANDRQIARALQAEYVRCCTCRFCIPIGEAGGHAKNRCQVKPGVFYTHVEHYCRQHPDVEWRLKRIEELNKIKNDGGAGNR